MFSADGISMVPEQKCTYYQLPQTCHTSRLSSCSQRRVQTDYLCVEKCLPGPVDSGCWCHFLGPPFTPASSSCTRTLIAVRLWPRACTLPGCIRTPPPPLSLPFLSLSLSLGRFTAPLYRLYHKCQHSMKVRYNCFYYNSATFTTQTSQQL